MDYREAIRLAEQKSREQRTERYDDSEGVWVEVYKDFGQYNLDGKGVKICAVEATKNGRTIHAY